MLTSSSPYPTGSAKGQKGHQQRTKRASANDRKEGHQQRATATVCNGHQQACMHGAKFANTRAPTLSCKHNTLCSQPGQALKQPATAGLNNQLSASDSGCCLPTKSGVSEFCFGFCVNSAFLDSPVSAAECRGVPYLHPRTKH